MPRSNSKEKRETFTACRNFHADYLKLLIDTKVTVKKYIWNDERIDINTAEIEYTFLANSIQNNSNSVVSELLSTAEHLSNAKEIYRVLKKGAKAYLNLRSVLDYRHINGKVISKYEVIVDEKDSSRPAYGENGMRVYHFDEEEVRRIYADFSHLTCDSIRHSFENNAYANDNLIVVLTK